MKKERTQEEMEIIDMVDEAGIMLGSLPSIIQTYMDNYKIGFSELSDEEMKNIGTAHNTLCNLLTLVQFTIRDYEEKIRNL